MKFLFSLLFIFFLSINAMSQDTVLQAIEKASISSQDINEQKEQKQEMLNNSKQTSQNIEPSVKNVDTLKESKNNAAIQAKIDYLIDLACCEEEILELQQQLKSQTIK